MFGIFQKFKNLIEKESDYFIKVMRTDREWEFTSVTFNKFCEYHDIQRFLMAPYSPQQNSVAKRKNRTTLDMVRNMLKSKNLPKELEGEAIMYAIYLQNRYITYGLEGITP